MNYFRNLLISLALLVSVHVIAQAAPPDVTAAVPLGHDFSLSATADGTQPFTYQWFKDGVTVPGFTGPMLTATAITAQYAGVYTVVISNPAGTTTSPKATITILGLAVFTTQPASQSGITGASVTFTVAVSGTGPFTYQWKKNAVVIVGATTPILALGAITTASAATYTCDVTNAAGTVTSNGAGLIVLTLPVFTSFGVTVK